MPSLPYSFETLIHCYSDVGVADSVKVRPDGLTVYLNMCPFLGICC